MAEQLPPQWAIERAIEITRVSSTVNEVVGQKVMFWPMLMEMAAYIASKEKAPVEPLVLEAREIVAQYFEEQGADSVAQEHREGLYDKDDESQELALRALRRGIEIGKAQA